MKKKSKTMDDRWHGEFHEWHTGGEQSICWAPGCYCKSNDEQLEKELLQLYDSFVPIVKKYHKKLLEVRVHMKAEILERSDSLNF